MDLEELHEAKHTETLKALEALAAVKRHALAQLQKTQILFKHLNWKQAEFINSHFEGNYYLEHIYNAKGDRSVNDRTAAGNTASRTAEPGSRSAGIITQLTPVPLVVPPRSTRVQKERIARNYILQCGIIQARAAELIETISKSVAVFNSQYKTCCRELFPLGFISRFLRKIRQLLNHSYYSWKDMESLKNLGLTALLVLKIAEVPVVRGRI